MWKLRSAVDVRVFSARPDDELAWWPHAARAHGAALARDDRDRSMMREEADQRHE